MKLLNPWSLTHEEANELLQDAYKDMMDSRSNSNKSRFHEAKKKYEKIQTQLAARPDFFNNIKCWMVDIHGTEKASKISHDQVIEIFDEFKDLLSYKKEFKIAIDKLILKQGPLGEDVIGFVSDKWSISDKGAGKEGWHLGVMCCHDEVSEITQSVYDRFKSSIDLGLIYMDVHFWGFKKLRENDE